MRKLVLKWSGYDRVRKLIDLDPEQDGHSFLRRAAEEFQIHACFFGLEERQFKSTIFFCTHHTGAIDLLATYPTLGMLAPDLRVVVNRKLLALEPMAKISISVNPLSSGIRNPEARAEITNHLRKGGNILVFPAGKVGIMRGGEVRDLPWRTGIAEIARDAAEQVIPVYVKAKNDTFFYAIRECFPRLSMLFLLRYLHRRTEKSVVSVLMGKPTSRKVLKQLSAEEILRRLRRELYSLPVQFSQQG